MNSPMADTGGADAALEVVTGTPDALAVNTPQRAVVSKTQISAIICRSDYTGQGGMILHEVAVGFVNLFYTVNVYNE